MYRGSKRTYFIQPVNGGPVKIGRAVNVANRFKDIQACSPVKLRVLGSLDFDCEYEFHEAFKSLRLHGEWFRPGRELVALIAHFCIDAIPEPPPPPARQLLRYDRSRDVLTSAPAAESEVAK